MTNGQDALPGSIFPARDSLADWDGVATDLLVEGADQSTPRVTVAITTFNRPAMLIEAVRSALAQDFAEPYRICVFDNNPASTGADDLLRTLPELRARDFRYYRHAENIGIFGNFNRCLTLTETEWLTILNDDDLLDANCLSTLFATLDADRSVDGIICEKRLFDQREGDGNLTVRHRGNGRTPGQKLWLVLTSRQGRGLLFDVVLGWAMSRRKFASGPTRRVRARMFFWGSVLGNGAGFVFRRARAIELGGFVPEEFPSSDHYFFARFADRFHLRQHRVACANVRIAENESANVNTIMLGTEQAYRLQQRMAGRQTPRWWLRFSPMLVAYYRADALKVWRKDIPAADFEHLLGIRLPSYRPRLLLLIRFLLGGY